MKTSFLICKVIVDRDGGFGLSVTLTGGEVKNFYSLTNNRDEIEGLCERINRLEVSEHHLYEILEDFLP